MIRKSASTPNAQAGYRWPHSKSHQYLLQIKIKINKLRDSLFCFILKVIHFLIFLRRMQHEHMFNFIAKMNYLLLFFSCSGTALYSILNPLSVPLLSVMNSNNDEELSTCNINESLVPLALFFNVFSVKERMKTRTKCSHLLLLEMY